VYAFALIFQTISFLYVWFGIRRKGVRVMDLIRGRWDSLTQVGRDIGIAAGIWVAWVGLEWLLRILLHAPNPQSFPQLLPRTMAEKLGWLVVSAAAGFCGELTFRGYLQRQFLAITGGVAPAILLQAALFAFGHGYQGGKLMVTIFIYGVLFGWLAWWRQDLRSCMLAHAWTDSINIFVRGQSL
jgi:membrane protease YdiL (CAAX protease family)